MIKNYFALIIIVFECHTAFSQISHKNLKKGEKSLLSKLEESHRRDGLPNIFHKISTQWQIKIAYMGGSITAASEGWRDLTFNWFRINYPQTALYSFIWGYITLKYFINHEKNSFNQFPSADIDYISFRTRI